MVLRVSSVGIWIKGAMVASRVTEVNGSGNDGQAATE
jgi:hypothetical protein